MNVVLGALSVVYRLVTSLRNTLYDSRIFRTYRVGLPVICVGNLTAGGNGKTPLCSVIVSELQSAGHRPVVLSRGYGGSARGTTLVSQRSTTTEVGDEPLLLSRRCPVVVDRDRVRGAKFIEERSLGNVIILDDGYQHRRLARDLNIVCVNIGNEAAVDAFLRGDILPLGRFREARDQGLRRAQLVVLSERGGEVVESERERARQAIPSELPVVRLVASGESPKPIGSARPFDPSRPVAAFCGLANPEGFFMAARRAGCNVIAEVPFADHHVFQQRDLDGIRVRHSGAALLCSEKDAVKLEWYRGDDLYVLPVSFEVVPREEFVGLVLGVTKR